MNNLSVFKFEESKEVRTVMVDNEPYFVGKDVAEVLGYSNTRDALAKHCKAKADVAIYDGSQNRKMVVIPERDVYRLIMRSKLPTAERFEEWVVGIVLPSIRKTGSYSVPQAKSMTQVSRNLLADKLEAATILADALNLTGSSRNGAFRRTVARLDADLLPMIPDYAIDAPVVAGQAGATSAEPCYSMTELLKRHNAPMGAITANKRLIVLGLLEEKERPSVNGKSKKFKCVTKSGLKYGKNVVSEQNPRETQPQWFESTFADLLGFIS